MEKPGAALGVDNHDLQKDLANLTQFIEAMADGAATCRRDAVGRSTYGS